MKPSTAPWRQGSQSSGSQVRAPESHGIGGKAWPLAYFRPVTVLEYRSKLGPRRSARPQGGSGAAQTIPNEHSTRSKVRRPRRMEEKNRPGENFLLETADLRCLSPVRTVKITALALATDGVPAQATSASLFLWAYFIVNRAMVVGGSGHTEAVELRLQWSPAALSCHPVRPLGVEGICGSNRCALACSCDRVRVCCCVV